MFPRVNMFWMYNESMLLNFNMHVFEFYQLLSISYVVWFSTSDQGTVYLSHPEILISECETFFHKKLKIFKRIHLF
jgi:hypothetical protein